MKLNIPYLKSKLFIIDGGNGAEIQKLMPMDDKKDLGSEWVAMTSETHPDIVEKVHKNFVDAGANFVIANTYNVNYNVLESIGEGEKCETLIKSSIRLARRAIGNKPETFLAGSISEHPPKCYHKEGDTKMQNFASWPDPETKYKNFQKTAVHLFDQDIDCLFIELILTKTHGYCLIDAVVDVWKKLPVENQVPLFLGLCPRFSESGKLV